MNGLEAPADGTRVSYQIDSVSGGAPMTWVKIDDKIRTHPKLLKAGPVASWLWICGLSYCADYLTDGAIPVEAIESLGVPSRFKPRELATRLTAVGLWIQEPDGFRVHDYHKYQLSREEVDRIREARRLAGQEGGRRSGAARRLKANGQANTKQVASILVEANEANGQANGKQNRTPYPYPSKDQEVIPQQQDQIVARVSPAAAGAGPLIPRRNMRFVHDGRVPVWDWQHTEFKRRLGGDTPENDDRLHLFYARVEARWEADGYTPAGQPKDEWLREFQREFSEPVAERPEPKRFASTATCRHEPTCTSPRMHANALAMGRPG